MPPAVAPMSAATNSVSNQSTATLNAWPNARGSVKIQKLRAIGDEVGRRVVASGGMVRLLLADEPEEQHDA